MKSHLIVAMSLIAVPSLAGPQDPPAPLPVPGYCCSARLRQNATYLALSGEPSGVEATSSTFRVTPGGQAVSLSASSFNRFATTGSPSFAGYDLARPFTLSVSAKGGTSVTLQAALQFSPAGASQPVRVTGESSAEGRPDTIRARVTYQIPGQVSEMGAVSVDVECRKTN